MNMQKAMLSFMLGKAPAGKADARLTISTPDLDREGDMLVPEGVVLDDYKKNPVVLFSHDHYSIPVGRTTDITVVPGRGIQADFVWLKNDVQADRVRNAFEQQMLNAASVGFQPLAYEPIATGYRYTKWALLEWSIVPVPANPNATGLLKSLGWDADRIIAVEFDREVEEPEPEFTITASEEDINRMVEDGITEAMNAFTGRVD